MLIVHIRKLEFPCRSAARFNVVGFLNFGRVHSVDASRLADCELQPVLSFCRTPTCIIDPKHAATQVRA